MIEYLISADRDMVCRAIAASDLKVDKLDKEEIQTLKAIVLGGWFGCKISVLIEKLEAVCDGCNMPRCATNWEKWRAAALEEEYQKDVQARARAKKAKRKRGFG